MRAVHIGVGARAGVCHLSLGGCAFDGAPTRNCGYFRRPSARICCALASPTWCEAQRANAMPNWGSGAGRRPSMGAGREGGRKGRCAGWEGGRQRRGGRGGKGWAGGEVLGRRRDEGHGRRGGKGGYEWSLSGEGCGSVTYRRGARIRGRGWESCTRRPHIGTCTMRCTCTHVYLRDYRDSVGVGAHIERRIRLLETDSARPCAGTGARRSKRQNSGVRSVRRCDGGSSSGYDRCCSGGYSGGVESRGSYAARHAACPAHASPHIRSDR